MLQFFHNSRSWLLLSLICCAARLSASPAIAADAAPQNWPQFRGPGGDGRADAAKLPVDLSEEKAKWKTPIPGKAWSSPVIWGNQIWISNATEDGKKLSALCVDLESGKVLQDILVFAPEKPQFCHDMNSYGTPTPYLEEGRAYVHFGVHGTAAIDTATGKILWKRDDLPCNHHRGPASSPIVYGDLVFLTFDGFDQQYLVALNKLDGKTAWKKDREFNFGTDNGDNRKAYSTPKVFDIAGKKALVSPAAVATEARDPVSGSLLWTIKHEGMNASAIPLYADDLMYITNGMGGMIAFKPQGSGDISSQIVWKGHKGVAKKASPLIVDGLLYMITDNGIVGCFDPKTGDQIWSERLKGEYAASPLYANGKLYFCGIDGVVTVMEAGREKKKLASATFPAGFMASPAVSGNALILRSKTHLYRFGE